MKDFLLILAGGIASAIGGALVSWLNFYFNSGKEKKEKECDKLELLFLKVMQLQDWVDRQFFRSIQINFQIEIVKEVKDPINEIKMLIWLHLPLFKEKYKNVFDGYKKFRNNLLKQEEYAAKQDKEKLEQERKAVVSTIVNVQTSTDDLLNSIVEYMEKSTQ